MDSVIAQLRSGQACIEQKVTGLAQAVVWETDRIIREFQAELATRSLVRGQEDAALHAELQKLVGQVQSMFVEQDASGQQLLGHLHAKIADFEWAMGALAGLTAAASF